MFSKSRSLGLASDFFFASLALASNFVFSTPPLILVLKRIVYFDLFPAFEKI